MHKNNLNFDKVSLESSPELSAGRNAVYTWGHWHDTLYRAQQVVLMWTAFSLLISVFAFSVGTVLTYILWIISGDFQEKVSLIRNSPVAKWALLLFLLMAIGTLYSAGEWSYRLFILQKYLKLLLVPVVISVVTEEVWRRRIYCAFLLSLGVVLTMSYLEFIGLIPLPSGKFQGQGYVVFRSHITHSLLMAYGVYLFAQHMVRDKKHAVFWGVAAALAIYNVLFMVSGRSGQLVLLVLVVLFGAQMRLGHKRGMAIGLTLSFSLLVMATTFSTVFKHRADLAVQEFQGYTSQDHPDVTHSSIGQRLQFYANTLALIRENPLFGSGTGSFSKLYAERAHTEGLSLATSNPHNEYLLLLQQIGMPGLIAFIMLGYKTWHDSTYLDALSKQAARGLIIMMGVGCFFNSLLMDVTEGGTYCLLVGLFFSATAKARLASSVP